MTHVFGPDTTLDELGLSERVASRLFAAWFPLANRALADQDWRFDREKLRLSVRGESEHSGDAFTRGRVVNAVWYLNSFIWILPFGFVTALTEPPAGVLFPVALAGVLLLAVGTFLNVIGSTHLARKTQVVDHTTEPKPEAISDLQAQYVGGEVDVGELEDRVEAVIER